MKWLSLIILLFVAGAALSAPDSLDTIAQSPVYLRPLALRHHSAPQPEIVPWRLAVFGTITAGAVGLCFSRMEDWWGAGKDVPFHFKQDDWGNDNLAQTDEISHALVSYKIAQAGMGLSRWSGLTPGTSRIVGGSISLSIMFGVEMVDAYNPYQGFGVSDMIFNTIGVAFAVARDRWPEHLGMFDLRLSIKSTEDMSSEIIAKTMAENFNYIYWLTVSPVRDYPVHFGLGYSANYDNPERIAEREIYLGFGTSIAEIAGIFDPRWRQRLDIYSFYDFTFSFRVH
ncbi:MAG TPA: DUF2279 domain-containing protein [candidate division Zixibacteria bacterium]|nr:DUF2279 domain-containing protein [candidate division Zixibacteria bacterium]